MPVFSRVKIRPSFSDYQRVAHLAANQWDGIKPDLLKTLRQSQEWEAREAKVDIFLHEGLLDDAIQAVRSDSYYRSFVGASRCAISGVGDRPTNR